GPSGRSNAGGHGASIQGDFAVTAGQQLTVLVGGAGGAGGGGGGSFVWKGSGFGALVANPTTALLVAAGGGGGGGGCSLGVDAVATSSGGADSADSGTAGGANGSGGSGGLGAGGGEP